MKTVNRGYLKRMVERGELEVVHYYSFDDMYGAQRGVPAPMPVEIDPGDWQKRKEGTCYLRPDHFTGYGRAWENPNGTITLIIHSNLNYTFKRKAA